MKISQRLIAGNIVVVLLVMMVGIFGLFTSENIVERFEQEEKHFRSIITAATEAASYAKRAEGHMMLFLTLSDEADRQKFFERCDSLAEEVKILNHSVKIPEARKYVDDIISNSEKLRPAGKSLLRAYDREMSSSGRFIPKQHEKDIRLLTDIAAEIRRLGVDLAIYETDKNFKNNKAAIHNAYVLQIYSTVIIAFAVIIALLQGYVFSRKIAVPISSLKEKVSEITSGNLDVSIEHRSKDEIGELTESFNAMTEALKKSQSAIISEKERLRVTLRSIGDGVITADINGRIILLNRSAEILTGWSQEEASEKSLHEVFSIVDEDTGRQRENPIEALLKTGEIIEPAGSSCLTARGGERKIISNSGAPIRDAKGEIIGVVLVFRDITEKIKMEHELIRSRNIESLGILAGGIAHDFNNILVGILGNISLAKRKLEKEDKTKIMERLSGVENAAGRAKDLTHQLLTFSKGGAPLLRTTFINNIVRDSARFALAGSNIMCSFVLHNDLWPVDIDKGQFSQVIHNLVLNAKWAMPEGGSIEIKADNVALDRNSSASSPLPEGRYIRISFRDEGIGILAEHLPKIFDPYFTTRGQGTGLGLATVYSIIKRHKGIISANSVKGEGSEFIVYLPASDKPVVTEELDITIVQGKGRILLMDDDDTVSDVTEGMLTDLGYETVLTKNGTEAIEIYSTALKSGNPFDAVILDLTIPGGMGGKDAIQELLRIDPKVRAIVSSGYSADPVMAEYQKYGFLDFIKKPYSLHEMSSVLQRVVS